MRTVAQALFHLAPDAIAQADFPLVIPNVDASRDQPFGNRPCQSFVLGRMGEVDEPLLIAGDALVHFPDLQAKPLLQLPRERLGACGFQAELLPDLADEDRRVFACFGVYDGGRLGVDFLGQIIESGVDRVLQQPVHEALARHLPSPSAKLDSQAGLPS